MNFVELADAFAAAASRWPGRRARLQWNKDGFPCMRHVYAAAIPADDSGDALAVAPEVAELDRLCLAAGPALDALLCRPDPDPVLRLLSIATEFAPVRYDGDAAVFSDVFRTMETACFGLDRARRSFEAAVKAQKQVDAEAAPETE